MLRNPFAKPEWRSVKASFFVSYTLILLVPMLLILAIVFYVSPLLEDEIQTSNELSLKQVANLVDGRILEMKTLASNLSLNENLLSLQNAPGDLSGFQHMIAYTMIRELRTYYASGGFIRNLYLYFRKGDFALDRNGRYAFKYFSRLLARDGLTAEALRALLNDTYRGEFRYAEGCGLLFLQSFPSNRSSERGVQFVYLLDAAVLNRLLSQSSWSEASLIFMLSPEGRVYACTDNAARYLDEGRSFASARQAIEAGGEDYITTEARSDESVLRLVSLMPKAIYLEKLSRVRLLMALGVFACIAVGSALVVHFGRKNYQPIHALERLLNGQAEEAPANVDGEYRAIADGVWKALYENRRLRSVNQQNTDYIRNSLLMNLLVGNDCAIDADSLAACGIRFRWREFFVAIFYIEDYDPAYPRYQGNNIMQTDDMLQNIIRMVTEVIRREDIATWSIEMNDFALLINAPEGAKERILYLMGEISSVLQSRLGISATIALSNPVEGLEHVKLAYDQARRLGRKRYYQADTPVLRPSETEAADAAIYILNNGQREQLVRAMRAAQFEAVRRLTRAGFADLPTRDPEAGRQMCASVAGVFASAVLEHYQIGGLDERRLRPMLYELMSAEEPEPLLEIVDAILDGLGQDSRADKDAISSALRQNIEKARQYIGEHFRQPDISGASVAEYLAMNQSYLSRTFKSVVGTGMLDCINQLRVDAAKGLLASTNKSILAVGQEVGFLSTNTFIRVFKRSTGITPKAYREMLLAALPPRP